MKGRNKTLIITSLIAIALAGLAFVIGGIIAGWNFKGWFTSNAAYAIYIILGLYIIVIGKIVLSDYINRY